MASIKFKRSMKLLLKDMVGLKMDFHNLRRQINMETKYKKDLTRAPINRKALQLT